ncbi:MAG TPA: CARDB domain-containing protein [Candidatus Paceibacterota bacterium]|nr:CARDB domain-containing protein [Verrucomicrobiota bacterium]HRY48502.1 CARDB domain-containing protein [Candidatus Paceibacterota bacterium]HRZ99671.1 CARDB domain-containing protein [Candidatus Paceibacterota bacterium]
MHFSVQICPDLAVVWRLILVLPVLITAQVNAADVTLAADLLTLFPGATTHGEMICQIERPARCGGVARDALSQLPQSTNQNARIEYDLSLPRVSRGELLLLHFAIGLADGARFDQGEDGVLFAIEANRQTIFSAVWQECRWLDQAVDLTDYAGRNIQLAFLTDARRNTNHDGSVWGAPRILHFHGAPQNGPEQPSLPYGIVAVHPKTNANLTLQLQSLDSTNEIVWTLTHPVTDGPVSSWHLFEYGFVDATRVKLNWTPVEAADTVWVNSLPAEPILLRLSPAQSIITPDSQIQVRALVRNQGQGYLSQGAAFVSLMAQDGAVFPAQPVPPLRPAEQTTVEWTWQAPSESGVHNLEAQLITTNGAPPQQMTTTIELLRAPYPQPSAYNRNLVLTNRHMKMELIRSNNGYSMATLWAWHKDQWVQIGVWRPLMQVLLDTPTGEQTWEIRPRSFDRGRTEDGSQPTSSLHYQGVVTDPEQADWAVALRIELDPDRPIARIHYLWQPSAPVKVKSLWGPNFYAGDGSSGSAKSWGLLPGLEYLFGPEPSSNPRDLSPPLHDRRTPHPWKITVPVMAVSMSPGQSTFLVRPGPFFCPDSLKDAPSEPYAFDDEVTLGLFWSPIQSGDAQDCIPSVRFSSPNLDEGMENHRLGLFLPSVPKYVSENADRARNSWGINSGQIIKLDASLVAASGPAMMVLREYYEAMGGFPAANSWPRSFEQELALCREAFMKTVWDSGATKWRHHTDGASHHAPGFATLLWLDAHIAADAVAKRESRARVESAAQKMLEDTGPALFISETNCHIMRWEFPFYYGFLEESLLALESRIRTSANAQHPEGGWIFEPGNEPEKTLGKVGDSVLGTSARHSADLLRYARITGDESARQSGEKALAFMEKFHVPRGGRAWECPIYQPDLLAAAWAIAAYLEGYRVSSNPRWLQLATYWAENGLPFVYQWSLDNHPMMLGATLPAFGSSFYTQSWLATPMQGSGLVYARYLQDLAFFLKKSPLTDQAASHPVLLNLAPEDWRRVAETITVSAMHQQIDQGDLAGTYPNSISGFEKRNPPFLNPENILVNVLLLQGYDPDVKTVRLTRGNERPLVISSGAGIAHAEIRDAELIVELIGHEGETSHTLISGLNPAAVLCNEQLLNRSSDPLKTAIGWHYNPQRQWTFLAIPHTHATARIQVRWAK